jgi:predicted dienelactone hydrolase
MRIFEILLLSVLYLFVFSMFVKPEKKNRWIYLLPGLSLSIVLVHIFVEGQRWQMLPMYLYAALLFGFTFKNISSVQRSSGNSKTKDKSLLRFVRGITNVLLLTAISMPPLLVPVFKLPIPTGPYDVGIKYDYFIDKNRPEPLTPDSTDFQEISVQVWYPAKISSDDRPVHYWENASKQSRIISTFWGGLPTFLFNHFSLTETHSYRDASLSKTEQTFPVLIFNHGSIGLPSLNTVLMEELASNGYIIFSIGHSDYAPFFIMPDGTIKAFDPTSEALQLKMRENNDPEVRSIAYQLMQSRDLHEQELLLRKFLDKNSQNQKSLFRWAEDISFSINELERLNNGNGFFSGRLDLDRIGVFGVSFGGAASTQVCVHEKRCRAAISMDCPQFGDLLDSDVSQPIMFMSSEQYEGMNDIFLQLKDNPLYMVMIRNTTHQNFSDVSVWGELFRMQMLGKIDGERCLQIQNRYIHAFFEKHLKGIDSKLLHGPSPEYPEVDIEMKNTE